MKKKLIAALCVQLTLVAMLLCYNQVFSALISKYGKEYSVPVYMDCCTAYHVDSDSEELRYAIDVYTKESVDTEGKEYKSIPNEIGEFRLEAPEPGVIVIANADYYIKDTALGERMNKIFERNSKTSRFQSLYPLSMENDVRLNFKVFGSKTELISVTINGKSPEDFFAENISEYEENNSFYDSFFDS